MMSAINDRPAIYAHRESDHSPEMSAMMLHTHQVIHREQSKGFPMRHLPPNLAEMACFQLWVKPERSIIYTTMAVMRRYSMQLFIFLDNLCSYLVHPSADGGVGYPHFLCHLSEGLTIRIQ